MRVLDLFSGIGGFSLGLELAGMQTVAFCEHDPFCQAVLRKHWPTVPIHDDVRTLSAKNIAGPVDVVCGGFPCQEVSHAGTRTGLAGKRSGLWSEFRRLIEEISPRFAIIENVSALRSRGLGTVLREIAALGYDAEWHCITASAVGAPHKRERIWIIAYPKGGALEKLPVVSSESISREFGGMRGSDKPFSYWADNKSPMAGMGNGVPGAMDRRDYCNRSAALGNAVVPQIPEIIGRAIMHAEALSD